MTPVQDMVALVAAVSTGVLLFASAPAHTPSRAVEPVISRPPAVVRELREEDLARLCADIVVPRKVGAYLQEGVEQLRSACRVVLKSTRMIPK